MGVESDFLLYDFLVENKIQAKSNIASCSSTSCNKKFELVPEGNLRKLLDLSFALFKN